MVLLASFPEPYAIPQYLPAARIYPGPRNPCVFEHQEAPDVPKHVRFSAFGWHPLKVTHFAKRFP